MTVFGISNAINSRWRFDIFQTMSTVLKTSKTVRWSSTFTMVVYTEYYIQVTFMIVLIINTCDSCTCINAEPYERNTHQFTTLWYYVVYRIWRCNHISVSWYFLEEIGRSFAITSIPWKSRNQSAIIRLHQSLHRWTFQLQCSPIPLIPTTPVIITVYPHVRTTSARVPMNYILQRLTHHLPIRVQSTVIVYSIAMNK